MRPRETCGLKQNFPPGVDFRDFDDSFRAQSIIAVVHTLFEAVLLVVIVVMFSALARVHHSAARRAVSLSARSQ
jgi:multidrug efflux pump subunit AcrB